MKPRNQLLVLILLLAPTLAVAEQNDEPQGYVDKPVKGWYWYDKKTKPPKNAPPAPASAPPPASPIERLARIEKIRKELLITAVLDPQPENIRRYKVVQDFLVNKASAFSATWQKVLLDYPELDYNLKHPFYNGAAPIEYAKERQAQARAIDQVNQRYGVFLFYRGQEPLDNKLGGVVKEFAAQYGLHLVPVSIDGRISADLPDSRRDAGQAKKMGIKHFPAIYLVEPGTGTYKPLAYGFITQDDLARRVLNVVTDFKPRD
ncbi:TPA: type-F conjugative transfer system pilin assembly protein TraF [Serratia marcescens]|nr:type-F conjugative transfer system pilin assembly protein TraF [Serratia marcescens]